MNGGFVEVESAGEGVKVGKVGTAERCDPFFEQAGVVRCGAQ